MQGHQGPPRSVLGHRSTVGTPSQPMRVAAALPRHQAGDGAGPAPHRPPPSTNNAQRGSSLILPPGAASSSSAGPNNSIGASALVLPPARGRLVVPAAASAAAARSTQSTPSVSHTAWTPPKTPLFLNNQRVHSLHERGLDVINSLTGWAQSELLRYLKPVSKSWQPADLLPDPASPEFYDQVTALRAAGSQLPYEYLVVLVGDMVTEEALPSYMNMLNTLDGTKDETGEQAHPWAHWTRHWTAEENRHGDLLNKYLYLCGRVDMRAVETTIQRLISSGLDPKLENNPYLCFVYTSFQERATKVSHGNTARLAAYYGDNALTRICGLIAADEGRHEAAYSLIVDQFFQRDPEGAVLAFADMMRKGIVMPAHLVDDGVHGARNNGANLFTDYATVADAIGVYTTTDYANIVDHLVSRWRVADLQGLSGEAAEAQEFLCGHSNRIRRLANIQAERRLRDRKRGRTREASFSWIQGRQVSLN